MRIRISFQSLRIYLLVLGVHSIEHYCNCWNYTDIKIFFHFQVILLQCNNFLTKRIVHCYSNYYFLKKCFSYKIKNIYHLTLKLLWKKIKTGKCKILVIPNIFICVFFPAHKSKCKYFVSQSVCGPKTCLAHHK